MKGLSFKKQARETGLRSVGNPVPSVDIKINKKVIGYLSAPTWQTKDNKWGINFSVVKPEPDENPNCKWKWIAVKTRFETENEAREFVKENIEAISKRYTLYSLE